MPVHDWTRVDAGLFHAFHQDWLIGLCNALNAGILPVDYFALAEQALQSPIYGEAMEAEVYARKADHITVRHRSGQEVAVLEIISPGNKASRIELRALVEKIVNLIRQGVHLLIVDLFPPDLRGPHGLHHEIWSEFHDEEFSLSREKPLSLVAYKAGLKMFEAYVEPVAVGDVLPDMPLFLQSDLFVRAPLEATYQASWSQFPTTLKGLLEGPAS